MRSSLMSFALVTLLVATACLGQVSIREVVSLATPGNARAPWGIDVDQAHQMVYVAGLEFPYKLAVVDGATNQIVGNIQLAGLFPHAVAVYSDIGRVYVTNTGGAKISVVDIPSQAEIMTIPGCSSPMGICVNTLTGLIYVANDSDNNVQVIDASTNSATDTIDVGWGPYGICANRVTNMIYTANLGESTVSVIDGSIGEVVATIPVGPYPRGICVNEVTNLIYVAERDANSVSVIDGNTNEVILTIPVGLSPHSICVDASRDRVYVVNADSRNVYVISGTAHSVTDSVAVGRLPVGGIAVDPGSNLIYVTNYESDDVSVIDGASSTVVATVRLGYFPHETGVDPLRDRWLVTNSFGNDVACVESHGDAPVWDTAVGYSPGEIRTCDYLDGIVVDRLYVALPDTNKVVVLDLATGAIEDSITVGSSPRGISINQTTDRLYTANHGDRSVSVICASTGDAVETIDLGWPPMDVEVNTVTNMVYVAAWMGILYAIDGATNTIVDSLSLSGVWEPNHMAVNESANKIYVTALNCTAVWIVDGEDYVLEAELATTDYPDQVAVNEHLGRAYVSTGGYLTVIEADNTISQTVWLLKMNAAGCSVDEDSSLIYVGCPRDGAVVILYDEAIASVGDVPREDRLSINSIVPNPFSQATHISYSVASVGIVRLRVYDTHGRLVKTLVGGETTSRSGLISWEGTTDSGHAVAPGIYLVALESQKQRVVRKICRVR